MAETYSGTQSLVCRWAPRIQDSPQADTQVAAANDKAVGALSGSMSTSLLVLAQLYMSSHRALSVSLSTTQQHSFSSKSAHNNAQRSLQNSSGVCIADPLGVSNVLALSSKCGQQGTSLGWGCSYAVLRHMPLHEGLTFSAYASSHMIQATCSSCLGGLSWVHLGRCRLRLVDHAPCLRAPAIKRRLRPNGVQIVRLCAEPPCRRLARQPTARRAPGGHHCYAAPPTPG